MESEITVLNKIYDSIIEGNLIKVKALLDFTSVNVNKIIPDKEMTVLHLAAGVEPAEFAEAVTKLILRHGGNPNECTEDKMTALHIAASWGRDKIVRLLLDNGADPYMKDLDSNTALDYANENYHQDVVDCIATYFQDDNAKDYPSPEMYSMTLDKVIIENGDYKGEYSVCDNVPDEQYVEADPIRKSLFIKQWCDSAEKITPKLIKNDQDIIRNKHGDLMFRRPLNFDTSSDKSRSSSEVINETKQSEYHSCNESVPSSTESKISEVSYKAKNRVSESTGGDDEFSSDDDKSLSGIDTLKFTKNDENNFYSVIHKNTFEELPSTPSKSAVFPHSPVPFPHVNYQTKTSLKNKKNLKSLIESKSDEKQEKELLNSLSKDGKDDKQIVEKSITGFDRMKSKSLIELIQDETLASVVEEYKYEDKDAGVVLIEKRVLTGAIPIANDAFDKSNAPSVVSSVSSLPLSVDYDTDGLRKELKNHGMIPGPITSSTKKVYLKRLKQLKKEAYLPNIQPNTKKKTYTVELEKTFRDTNWNCDLSAYISLEGKVANQFEMPNPKTRWREGIIKSSFTYLLLDPRVTENLPSKFGSMEPAESWRIFIDSIFYIGKGKRSRPYSHLYQAVSVYNVGQRQSQDKKVQHILDVWKDGLGVVCLHIFQNVIPVEAYTREAAMIEVMGLKNLKNIKPGNYYGVASSWSLKDKKKLGLYLLYRAMLIFFNEGERQLRPADIC